VNRKPANLAVPAGTVPTTVLLVSGVPLASRPGSVLKVEQRHVIELPLVVLFQFDGHFLTAIIHEPHIVHVKAEVAWSEVDLVAPAPGYDRPQASSLVPTIA
jgi:hypothetical protein